jgi:hypothetical protein
LKPEPGQEQGGQAEAGETAVVQPWWLAYLLLSAVGASLAIVVFAWGDWATLALAVLIAGGAWVAGGLLGFLFGIPRSLAEQPRGGADEAGASYGANTNLEQISDWLTKILVGVGLVQFTAFAAKFGDLVNFLGPALGGGQEGEAFAGAVLVLFSIGGFLSFYLFTRIYLPRAFAQADRGMVLRVVRKEIAEVKATQRAQETNDIAALSKAARQLDPEPDAPPIPEDELQSAVGEASPLVKAQIFGRARDQRRRTLSTDKAKMERTIPIFRALIASDADGKFHRNYAQLGYALKDQRQPDLAGAEAALTKAIELRDKEGAHGFRLYEFNRAVTLIRRYDPNWPPEVRARIEADLSAAEASPYLAKQISADKEITAFRASAPAGP